MASLLTQEGGDHTGSGTNFKDTGIRRQTDRPEHLEGEPGLEGCVGDNIWLARKVPSLEGGSEKAIDGLVGEIEVHVRTVVDVGREEDCEKSHSLPAGAARRRRQRPSVWSPTKVEIMPFSDSGAEHGCSVVIPVYRGEHTLSPVVEELLPLTERQCTPGGRAWRLAEVVLVNDGGPDRSDKVIRKLASEYPCVRPVWLSRNFGQHAATVAGMSSTGSEWIVTLDEDGQFDPNDIGRMLDVALDRRAPLVYARPTTPPPHGLVRNLCSNLAKGVVTKLLVARNFPRFSSFRLMLGDVGRGVAAYMGPGVYLDVALMWVFPIAEACPVRFRDELTRPSGSGYSFRSLLTHFWQLVVSAGTRPLRLVSLVGAATTFGGIIFALVILFEYAFGNIHFQGYTSLMIVLLVLGGAILFSLGVIAEYIGAAVRMAMGKPLYLITSDPGKGPLHREDGVEADPVAVD